MDDQQQMHETRGPQVLVIVILFPILAAITVALRLYTRFRIIAHPALDDLFAVLGLLFSIATSVCMCYQVHYGMGRHIYTLTLAQGVGSLKALYASIIVYNFGLLSVKLSILLQYLRICASKNVRRLVYAAMIFVCVYGAQCFFGAVFMCIPIHKFWDTEIPGHCINEHATWFVNAGLNIFSDLLLLVLPVFILKDLILKVRQKVALSLIMGFGGFACVASIVRLHTLYVVTKSNDLTWDNPGTAIWSSIELNVALICSCLGTLRPLLTRYFPGLSATIQSSSKHPYANSQAQRNGIKVTKTVETTQSGREGWSGASCSTKVDTGDIELSEEHLNAKRTGTSVASHETAYSDDRDDCRIQTGV